MKFILFAFLFVSVHNSFVLGQESSLFSPIKLHSASSVVQSKYGPPQNIHSIYFTVEETASPLIKASVMMASIAGNNTFCEIGGEFIRQLNPKKNLWRMGWSDDCPSLAANENIIFYLKMLTADGKEYRDDNKGYNYNVVANSGYYLPSFSNAEHLGGMYCSESSAHFYFIIRNLGYYKNIRIVFSRENQEITQTAYAQYPGNPMTVGYGLIANPSPINNTEIWTATLFKLGEHASIHYQIIYEIAGQDTIVDNNKGLGYTLRCE